MNFFKKLFKNKGTIGAILDPREPMAKGLDYSLDEIVTKSDDAPFSHPKPTSLSFDFDQYQTLSCVPHSIHSQFAYNGIALLGGEWISGGRFSPHIILSRLQTYRKRINFPSGGMFIQDCYDKIKKGVRYYAQIPTPLNCTETQANAISYDEGIVKNDFNYHTSTTPSKALRFVNAGIAVEVFIYASVNEWSREFVKATDNVSFEKAVVRHGVVLIPRGDFNQDGVNWFAAHDSAKFGGRFLRYVSEDFLLSRCFAVGVALPIIKDQTIPEVKPTVAVKFGERNENVKILQEYLIKKGYLGVVYNTGYYGNLTAKSVLRWQLGNLSSFEENGYSEEELRELGGRYFGKISLKIV